MTRKTQLTALALAAALLLSGCDSAPLPDITTTEAVDHSAVSETASLEEQPDPLPLFEYTLTDGKATIRKYNGTNTEVVVPSEIDGYPVAVVNGYAFSGHDITYLSLSEGITGILGFENFQQLEELHLPSTIEEITTVGTLGSLRSLKSINAAPSGKYSSADGVLYSGDGRTLVRMPAGRTGEFTVPDTVETIGKAAFRNSALTSVTVPPSVKTIEASAFAESALESVTLSEGLETVGFYAFEKTNLTELTLPSSVKSCDKKILGDLDIPISADAPIRGLSDLKAYTNVTYRNDNMLLRALSSAEEHSVPGHTAGLIFMDITGDDFPEMIEINRGSWFDIYYYIPEKGDWEYIFMIDQDESLPYYMGWHGYNSDILPLRNDATGETRYAVLCYSYDYDFNMAGDFSPEDRRYYYEFLYYDENGEIAHTSADIENSGYTPTGGGLWDYIEEHDLNGEFYVLTDKFADEPFGDPGNASPLRINGVEITEYPYIDMSFPKNMQILAGGVDILHGAQYDGITYDYMSNTVTLENVDIDVTGNIGLEMKNTGYTDIVLVGTNRIISDRLSVAAYDRITVTGDGELITNNIYVDDESGIASSGSCLTIEGNARITEPESGGAIEVNYLVMKDNAYLKMSNCDLWDIEISGYAVFRAENASTFEDISGIDIYEHGEMHIQARNTAFARSDGATGYRVRDDGILEIDAGKNGIGFNPYYCVLSLYDRAQVTIRAKETCIREASVIKFGGGRLELISEDYSAAFLEIPLRDMGDHTGEIYVTDGTEAISEPADWQLTEGYFPAQYWNWTLMYQLSDADGEPLKHFVLYSE